MMAVFDDSETRDKAFTAAMDSDMSIYYIGEIRPVLAGKPAANARPMILFLARTPMDALLFMQHGAGSCGQL